MNLQTNFQMLEKVNKYADYEFNIFSNSNINIYCLLKKRDRRARWIIRLSDAYVIVRNPMHLSR